MTDQTKITLQPKSTDHANVVRRVRHTVDKLDPAELAKNMEDSKTAKKTTRTRKSTSDTAADEAEVKTTRRTTKKDASTTEVASEEKKTTKRSTKKAADKVETTDSNSAATAVSKATEQDTARDSDTTSPASKTKADATESTKEASKEVAKEATKEASSTATAKADSSSETAKDAATDVASGTKAAAQDDAKASKDAKADAKKDDVKGDNEERIAQLAANLQRNLAFQQEMKARQIEEKARKEKEKKEKQAQQKQKQNNNNRNQNQGRNNYRSNNKGEEQQPSVQIKIAGKDGKAPAKEAKASKGNNQRPAQPTLVVKPKADETKKFDKKAGGKASADRDFDGGKAGASKKSAGKGAKSRVTSGSHYIIDDENDSYSALAAKFTGADRQKQKKAPKKKLQTAQSFNKPTEVQKRDVIIGETITISELSNRMAVKASEIVKFFFNMGEMFTINSVLPQDMAQLVAEEFKHNVILRNDNDLEMELLNENSDQQAQGELAPRAPVVTIMGHVDHGKTSLLDYIRKTRVAAGEAGGITQHIGAYHVTLPSGRAITFLDTPGHAAFTNMRARGAKATDIVILVVAADDGVMPQTIEAIQHARAAEVPIIVAVNKIDKPEANPQRVRNELLQHGVISEDLGGDEIFVDVSAKQGINIDELLETIALQAEVLELQATAQGPAKGVVIESCLDKGRGPVATVLIQSGTLNRGDIVLCGLEYGKVRAMRNELGQNLEAAGPSIPVEILGLSGVPAAGDEVTVVSDERKAREVANYRQTKFKEAKLARQQKTKLENLFANKDADKVNELNVVLKADVQGSVEAIRESLLKLATDEVKVNIIASGVGGISETDATLALASNAIIIGFNVRADATARNVVERENIDLRYYSIIYDLINEVKAAMSGLLAPEYKQTIIGLAEVRDVFRSPKFGQVAGCMVTEGIIKRNNPIRVLRDNIVIYEGELESLRRFKDDVSEVRNGTECGIGVRNYNDVRVGDQIEVYEVTVIQRSI